MQLLTNEEIDSVNGGAFFKKIWQDIKNFFKYPHASYSTTFSDSDIGFGPSPPPPTTDDGEDSGLSVRKTIGGGISRSMAN